MLEPYNEWYLKYSVIIENDMAYRVKDVEGKTMKITTNAFLTKGMKVKDVQ
jgi:hypothetical protein